MHHHKSKRMCWVVVAVCFGLGRWWHCWSQKLPLSSTLKAFHMLALC